MLDKAPWFCNGLLPLTAENTAYSAFYPGKSLPASIRPDRGHVICVLCKAASGKFAVTLILRQISY